MAKLRWIFSISLLIMLIWSTQTLAPTSDDYNHLLLNDIIADFQILSTLLGDVYVCDNYLLTNRAQDTDSAAGYLAQGFDHTLAESIVDYYLFHVPELERLAVVPTDAIPVLTAADRHYLQIHRCSPREVLINRIYQDCYLPGDLYFYQITARFNGERWIISDLSLTPSPLNSQNLFYSTQQ